MLDKLRNSNLNPVFHNQPHACQAGDPVPLFQPLMKANTCPLISSKNSLMIQMLYESLHTGGTCQIEHNYLAAAIYELRSLMSCSLAHVTCKDSLLSQAFTHFFFGISI